MSHQRPALQRRSSAPPAHPEAELPHSEEACLSTSPASPSPTSSHSHEPPSPAPMSPPPPATSAAAVAENGSSRTKSLITVPSKSKSGKLRKKFKKLKKSKQLKQWYLSTRERLRIILRERRRGKGSPSPVALPAQETQGERTEEDCLKHIDFIIAEHTPTGISDHSPIPAIAYFDVNSTEGPAQRPFVLVDETFLSGGKPDGFTPYDDPENPPISLKNPDGTKMKLIGKFPVEWSPQGQIKKCAGQQCVVLPEGSLTGASFDPGFIIELNPDMPLVMMASTGDQGQGQGGKRPRKSSVDEEAVEKKRRDIDLEMKAQKFLQEEIEKKKEKRKKEKKEKEKEEAMANQQTRAITKRSTKKRH